MEILALIARLEIALGCAAWGASLLLRSPARKQLCRDVATIMGVFGLGILVSLRALVDQDAWSFIAYWLVIRTLVSTSLTQPRTPAEKGSDRSVRKWMIQACSRKSAT